MDLLKETQLPQQILKRLIYTVSDLIEFKKFIITNKNQIVSDKRIEIKEVFKTSDLITLEKAILLSSFAFRKQHPKRTINSLYYDTYRYDSLTDSIEGSSERKKFRIRWYGNTSEETPSSLEIKNKKGHLSWKVLYKDLVTIQPTAKNWESFIKRKSKFEKFKMLLINQHPKTIVTYNRDYYVSFDGKIRLTIDQNLKTYKQENIQKPNLTKYRPHFNFVIFEIKIDQRNEYLLRKVLREFPYSVKRFSKYCESVLPQKYY